MARDLTKYLHGDMDKEAGIEHTSHRTKIVATVGPACDTYDKLLELVKAGVNIFRLNFSHGSHEDKSKNLFREPRLHLTSNNSVKNTIITAVSCLVESLTVF